MINIRLLSLIFVLIFLLNTDAFSQSKNTNTTKPVPKIFYEKDIDLPITDINVEKTIKITDPVKFHQHGETVAFTTQKDSTDLRYFSILYNGNELTLTVNGLTTFFTIEARMLVGPNGMLQNNLDFMVDPSTTTWSIPIDLLFFGIKEPVAQDVITFYFGRHKNKKRSLFFCFQSNRNHKHRFTFECTNTQYLDGK